MERVPAAKFESSGRGQDPAGPAFAVTFVDSSGQCRLALNLSHMPQLQPRHAACVDLQSALLSDGRGNSR